MPFKPSKKIYDPASLYEYAVQALGRRMRTVAELKRLLRQKHVEENVEGDKDIAIEAVIRKLKDQRYLNDTQYAALYSASRKDGAKHGSGRIINDLRVKGVHKDVIDKAISTTFEGVNEEDIARDYIAKKKLKRPSKPDYKDPKSRLQSQKETAKIFRALVRAGFRSQTIIKVLKTWGAEDEVLTELDEESAL